VKLVPLALKVSRVKLVLPDPRVSKVYREKLASREK
jgi:hypothetical protein